MPETTRDRWQRIYASKAATEMSWYAPHLQESLRLIQEVAPLDARIVDIGAGASTLVDDLLDLGYTNLTVLDISDAALDISRTRLGARSDGVAWRVADVTSARFDENSIDVWHDRAVFHFLTDAADRKAYLQNLYRSVVPGGYIVLSTFAREGPSRCSGLDVVRYDAVTLSNELGPDLELDCSGESVHPTPTGQEQRFVACRFRRRERASAAIVAQRRAAGIDRAFAGSIPALYEARLVPMLFESYAADLARRLASRPVLRLLELAAGTGVVTRALATTLPDDVAIVATDLNQAMIDQAAAVGTSRPVTWRQADAMQLPFGAGEFDAIVCQFGVMFFPDRAKAFAEAHRVLRPGGLLLFNVWDRIEENELADAVTSSLESIFPHDPPRFLARTPHGYFDRAIIARDLAAGGFTAVPRFETVSARSRAESPRIPAIAFCEGTPLRLEIEARDASRLGEAVDVAASAIAQRFGGGAVDARMQATVVTVEK